MSAAQRANQPSRHSAVAGAERVFTERPAAERPATERRAAIVRCGGVRHWYDTPATRHGAASRNEVLPTTSLQLGGARCEAVVGDGVAPVTLLHCIAGLVAPREGTVEWYDSMGRHALRPRVALVPRGWRPYGCYTVRDVLEHAVRPGTLQEDADALIASALRRCQLGRDADRLTVDLSSPLLPLLGAAAAVVRGCDWILIEAGGMERPGRGEEHPSVARILASAVGRLVRDGMTLILGGTEKGCAAWAPRRLHQLHRLPRDASGQAHPEGCAARVAEGAPVATVSAPT